MLISWGAFAVAVVALPGQLQAEKKEGTGPEIIVNGEKPDPEPIASCPGGLTMVNGDCEPSWGSGTGNGPGDWAGPGKGSDGEDDGGNGTVCPEGTAPQSTPEGKVCVEIETPCESCQAAYDECIDAAQRLGDFCSNNWAPDFARRMCNKGQGIGGRTVPTQGLLCKPNPLCGVFTGDCYSAGLHPTCKPAKTACANDWMSGRPGSDTSGGSWSINSVFGFNSGEHSVTIGERGGLVESCTNIQMNYETSTCVTTAVACEEQHQCE